MHKGWISIYRKALENPFCMNNCEKLGFWIYLLLRANHKPNDVFVGNQKIHIKKGQFKAGRKQISDSTGVQEMKVERWLTCLESEQQIEQQKFSKYRLISIVKWDEHQQIEQQIEQQMNNKRTTDEQQMNTNNNVNNNNNVNKDAAKPPFNEILNIYNKILSDILREEIHPTSEHIISLNATWKIKEEFRTLEFWEQLFKSIRNMQWLHEKDWCDFGWIIDPKNISSIVTGKYVKKYTPKSTGGLSGNDLAIAEYKRERDAEKS